MSTERTDQTMAHKENHPYTSPAERDSPRESQLTNHRLKNDGAQWDRGYLAKGIGKRTLRRRPASKHRLLMEGMVEIGNGAS